MLTVSSFRAIRPDTRLVSSVAALPYDVLNSEEARVVAQGNPHSFLHVTKAEIDLPEGTDLYDDSVYAKACENLTKFLEDGTLIADDERHIFLYRQIMGDHAQTGIVACAHIDDYAQGRIKRHELTRKDKEDDRTRHVRDTQINAGPVFLAYRDREDLTRLIECDGSREPLYDFVAADGVRHTVWIVEDADAYRKAFENVDAAYIADGHHRAASAYRAGKEMRDRLGDGEHCHFLAVFFAASQLDILPYNRVLKDRNGLSDADILNRLRELGTLEENAEAKPAAAHEFCFYLGATWYRLTLSSEHYEGLDAVGSLDVALLQDLVLRPLFGIEDPRTDKRIDFVGGIRGTEELERLCDGGAGVMAVSMFATSIHDLFAVADAGMLMPPKSTWFEPKLRSGLLIHKIVG